MAIHCTNNAGDSWVDAGLAKQSAVKGIIPAIQKSLEMTATQTKYRFVCGPIDLDLNFLSPLLADDLELLSRPVSFIGFSIKSNDGKEHTAELNFAASSDLARNSTKQSVKTEELNSGGFPYLKAGTREQPILKRKGDDVRIDWGYLYLTSPNTEASYHSVPNTQIMEYLLKDGFHPGKSQTPASTGSYLLVDIRFPNVKTEIRQGTLLLAYDDIYSIQYFKQNLQAWWKKDEGSMVELLKKSSKDYEFIRKKCDDFDRQLYRDAIEAGGETYAKLCVMAYRQSLAAHKLVRGPSDEILFPQIDSLGLHGLLTDLRDQLTAVGCRTRSLRSPRSSAPR